MKKFKITYKKITSVLLFITFFGVIISDVVSFHLNNVYHIELIKDNLEFAKLTKGDSKVLKKLIPTDLLSNNHFLISKSTEKIKIDFLENYLIAEEFCFKEAILQYNTLPLRAPPIS